MANTAVLKAGITVLAIAMAASASAQHTKGIIMHSGDTVFCDYSLKGNFITVKKAGTAVEMLSAGDVQSVFSNNQNTVVLPLRLETYTDNPNEIFDPLGKNRSEYDTTLLLNEIFSTPRMKLYKAFDKRRVPYYFVKKTADKLPAQLLIRYTVYYAPIGEFTTYGNPNLTVERIYIDHLKGLMNDCTRLSDGDFEIVDYRDYSLVKIIKKYNKKCR